MKILIRFGDLMLKGKNIKTFINKMNQNIKFKMKGLEVSFDLKHDRTYIDFDESLKEEVVKRIDTIPGIHSYTIVYFSESKETEDIVNLASKVLNEYYKGMSLTFKIDSKRSDKTYPLTSQDFTKMIAPLILKSTNINFKIDVKNPEAILNIDIRKEGVYMYTQMHMAMGGYPAGIAGKGLVMMSGGIDSPVSAYLAMKQGVEVELFHFESTPMTPLESVQKVIDLAKKLAIFTPRNQIKLHLVPFSEIHKALLINVKDSYTITIMRRMMYRIAEMYAEKNKIGILINGESLGQVASQTISSMKVVEAVTTMPIVRPVVTYDKNDIIAIAKKIDTFDISIQPFNDCCSIYVPRNPVINPKIKEAEFLEKLFDYKPMLDKAIQEIITINIKPDTPFVIYEHGFDVKEAYNSYLGDKDDNF